MSQTRSESRARSASRTPRDKSGVRDEKVISINMIIDQQFLSHLLIAGCDIGVQICVRPSVRPSVRSSVRPSTFTSKFGFLYISDSKECETLHSNCP